jgi:hypothetical protein
MTLTAYPTSGWYEITSEGQVTLYLSITDEGMITSPSDTPANTAFRPRLLNPEAFSIKRSPQFWVWGNASIQGAAFGQLELDNYDGLYNDLIDLDVRDSVITVKVMTAGMLQTGTAHADALTVCTAIIDDVQSDNEDHVTITLKDTIARLDRILPVRYNPPFVDEGAANLMIPLSFGAFRNVKPLLVDSANRLYQLHDTPIPNVTRVADKAAPLDPYASPPQYTPALDGSGLQLATLPVGPLAVDGSSYGTQSIIPGADDVFAYSDGSYGDFTAWDTSPTRPHGWTFSNNTGSVSQSNNYLHSGHTAAVITSARAWIPSSSRYGEQLYFPSILQGGRSYRLNFTAANISVSASTNPANLGGLLIATALTNNARDYIAGYQAPINGIGTYPNPPAQNLSFEFTVPPGATRPLYFIVAATKSGSSAVGTASVAIYNVTLELLGQYPELPESGIPFGDYLHEILVHRAGEDATIFNATEANALTTADDGSLIPFGIHFESPPNIMGECINPVVQSFRGVTFTDNLGVLRFRQFVDPTDPANAVIADFNMTNIDRYIQQGADKATGLTTIVGARRNWFVHGQSDFVTDTVTVPPDVRTRYSRTSLYQLTSSRSPAGQYSFAIGASIFDSLHDDPDFAQEMIDDVVGIFSPNVYPDGTFSSGKRKQVTLVARYDDPTAVGVTVQANINDLVFGSIIRFTYENADGSERYSNQLAEIIAWEVFAFAQRVALTVEF